MKSATTNEVYRLAKLSAVGLISVALVAMATTPRIAWSATLISALRDMLFACVIVSLIHPIRWATSWKKSKAEAKDSGDPLAYWFPPLIGLAIWMSIAVRLLKASDSERLALIKWGLLHFLIGCVLLLMVVPCLVGGVLLLQRLLFGGRVKEAEWKACLEAALTKQRSLPAEQCNPNEFVVLTAVKGLDFEAWRNRFQNIVPSSKKGSRMEPRGAALLEIEDLTNSEGIPNQCRVNIHRDLSVKEFSAFLVHRLLGFEELPCEFHSHVEFPAMEIAFADKDKTLRSLGVQSGDLVVLYVRQLRMAPAMVSSVSDRLKGRLLTRRTLDDFFATVVTRENEDYLWMHRHRDAWDIESAKATPRPLCIGSLLLYTEEDADLAIYVRQYYAVLHRMSGCYLTIYTFEHCPSATEEQQVSLRRFWENAIPPWVYSVWRQIGLTKSKPYPSKEMYDIAESLGLAPRDLPCLLLFRDWNNVATQRIVLPVRGFPRDFFRNICSDVRDVLEQLGKEQPTLKFLAEMEFNNFARHYRRTHSGKLSVASGSSTDPPIGREPYVVRRVFISHSSADKDFVERLAIDLRNNAVGVWLDKWETRVPDSILNKISQGIEQSAFLAVVLSKASVRSEWVRKELNAALMLEIEGRRVVVLPILLEECDIPVLLKEKRYADFSHNYRDGFNALLEVFNA